MPRRESSRMQDWYNSHEPNQQLAVMGTSGRSAHQVEMELKKRQREIEQPKPERERQIHAEQMRRLEEHRRTAEREEKKNREAERRYASRRG